MGSLGAISLPVSTPQCERKSVGLYFEVTFILGGKQSPNKNCCVLGYAMGTQSWVLVLFVHRASQQLCKVGRKSKLCRVSNLLKVTQLIRAQAGVAVHAGLTPARSLFSPQLLPLRSTRVCLTFPPTQFSVELMPFDQLYKPFLQNAAVVLVELHSPSGNLCVPPHSALTAAFFHSGRDWSVDCTEGPRIVASPDMSEEKTVFVPFTIWTSGSRAFEHELWSQPSWA